MTDTKNHSSESSTLEGRVFRPTTVADASEAVELAFDYRGDITLELKSGERLTGYVFNREAAGSLPYLELFPSDQPGARKVLYSDVESLIFTGEDTASGKSWEAWVAKKGSERRAEADRITAAAKARGHL